MKLTNQTKSPFHARSKALDVVEGLDLSGKVALITGGYSGLGFESVKAMSSAGARIIVGARDFEKAQERFQEINNVIAYQLDLSDLNSVQRFSSTMKNEGIHFDFVICNAGIMATPEQRVGAGLEMQFATNHLGHYALVNLIWTNINPGARVVCVSSAGHHLSPIRWDDIQFENGYDKWLAYGQSKTANALFAYQLDKYGKEHGIRAYSLHPGKIFTPLQRHLSDEEMAQEGWIDSNGKPIDPTFKSPEQGASTQVWVATSPLLEGLGGLYCEDCNIAGMASEYQEPFVGACSYALDADEASKLWKYSAEVTGVNAF
ncbi:SDR family NAD(P)-dependent oxidoreductase [Vibrio ouci]|uniref:Probable oxidoreductase n=1 Tax=Vibrio ouci TaxID=2499078 RepID=A0A4Y8WDC5_9VIBR|nr:SDR family NAD(P)-dependent oxidoreductase [Vibrio ouci]TFH90271.1 SDR family NAD(P)-dependent oxidoreductase [Vibrio ouci]